MLTKYINHIRIPLLEKWIRYLAQEAGHLLWIPALTLLFGWQVHVRFSHGEAMVVAVGQGGEGSVYFGKYQRLDYDLSDSRGTATTHTLSDRFSSRDRHEDSSHLMEGKNITLPLVLSVPHILSLNLSLSLSLCNGQREVEIMETMICSTLC